MMKKNQRLVYYSLEFVKKHKKRVAVLSITVGLLVCLESPDYNCC